MALDRLDTPWIPATDESEIEERRDLWRRVLWWTQRGEVHFLDRSMSDEEKLTESLLSSLERGIAVFHGEGSQSVTELGLESEVFGVGQLERWWWLSLEVTQTMFPSSLWARVKWQRIGASRGR
jgi:hypothetical protein